ncbi:MAG TPA: FHA domain-containing protein [Pyrinomonadaceae bacterium]|nr:FHA domain-containing protein [Pyrinomonadaceae bacterium]
MKQIAFAAEIQGRLQIETTYSQPVIAVGRNPATCQIVFDQQQWPTVSRQHAEFRLQNGSWTVVDKGSTYGTFLDGQLVKKPAPLRQNSRVQFGPGGPVLVVTRIEQEVPRTVIDEPRQAPRSPSTPSVQPPAQRPPAAAPQVRQAQRVFVDMSGTGTQGLHRLELTKELTRFGRDPEVEGVIDAAAAVVSRRHAEIRRQNGKYVLFDLGSFNGTLLNGRRIAEPEPLYHNDKIELGPGGPTIGFVDPSNPVPRPALQPAQHVAPAQFPLAESPSARKMGTMVIGSESPLQISHAGIGDRPQIFMERAFGSTGQLTIGRSEECDIRLDGLLISNRHASVLNTTAGVAIEDLGSSNGTYINGERITGRRPVRPEDDIQVGPFLLKVHPQLGVAVFDTRSKTRIDVFQVTKEVPNRSGGGKVRLLDEVCLSIQPNEFVGLLGPSGAGKSTLMDALNGMRPASSGGVFVNNLDLYQHLESLKQSIGYVPQDDIIHRELTVYNTLYYVARLRLSRDISTKEINQIVDEVMDVTGLSERRDVPISQLSGGQRKRVSIAVELITKPSVIFLDEPTSGLDPATEEKVMKLFRQIAESGRTVILTTHAMENVKLFDKIVVLMRGKLVFYGKPHEALAHVGAESFKDLYDKLEAPISERLQKTSGNMSREQAAEEVAEQWKRRFIGTEQYKCNVADPLSAFSNTPRQAAPAKRRTTIVDSIRQWGTLSRRYLGVLGRDKFNLFILFAQAPIIALLTYLVVGEKAQRDFPFFILALVALWFGTSVASREIIRERAVYNRERMVNLRLLPYIGSKLFVLMLIVSFQCFLLFGTLKFLDVTTLMSLPGYLLGLPQLMIMILTGMVGVALGLFISAVVKTSEMATSLVPLILIPQILFSGLVGVPVSFAKVVGVAMPATWAFDEMKRLSGLEVLRAKDEDAEPAENNEGRGLYKQIEHENDASIADAREKIDEYKSDAERNSKDFEKKMDQYQKDLMAGGSPTKPTPPKLGPAPEIAEATRIPDDLSGYVDFLHPWGGHFTNLAVLLTMLFVFLGATGISLRAQDI